VERVCFLEQVGKDLPRTLPGHLLFSFCRVNIESAMERVLCGFAVPTQCYRV